MAMDTWSRLVFLVWFRLFRTLLDDSFIFGEFFQSLL